MISGAAAFQYLDEYLLLLPQKALFWKNTSTLIVADVHLGKVGHFRKAGIAIPRALEQEDLALLSDLIHEYKPLRIIFLGDFFHSDMNNDWDWIVMWRDLYKNIEMVLVRGNHDIIHDRFYEKLGFSLHETLSEGPFLFTHEPLDPAELKQAKGYVISGHIHPGVKLRGKGRQSAVLPCYCFGDRQGLLPSFGKFTGKFCIRHNADDRVYGIVHNKVMAL
ncbi:MAG TPA: ligase-associated DNA damage response endonuclease PdeM [Sphingobacteriaceae bacterium]